MDDKVALRRRMRMVRDLVDNHLVRSVEMWRRVAELDEYLTAETVMAFVAAKGEPDTDPLFARLRADGKRLVLPRVEGAEIVVGDGDAPRAASAFGIDEPQGPALDRSVVDLVVVPGLAFTADGHRLGYGGGYYDRFLASLPTVPTIGVCFVEQLVDELPIAPHDVKVRRVVSA